MGPGPTHLQSIVRVRSVALYSYTILINQLLMSGGSTQKPTIVEVGSGWLGFPSRDCNCKGSKSRAYMSTSMIMRYTYLRYSLPELDKPSTTMILVIIYLHNYNPLAPYKSPMSICCSMSFSMLFAVLGNYLGAQILNQISLNPKP